ncbi:nuclear localization sequence-binding protein-like [Teratosphaeria destructans]|uniref:Nuclear localization sequence-binding protein-like n=1 Tax=Teratosphaeria destructans TaxID=418781 RepID=A0A9W7W3X5_9PEZI|nr:nuclear localization sequence-binding protein-like [Teratosphaeria destructans]
MPPKVLAKNPDRPSGVLPVNAAQRAAPAKAPAPKLKLHLRRLPPGLTLTELEDALGDEWRLGNGKVDWREYTPGKVKAPGKIHQQAGCYFHVTTEACVHELNARHLEVIANNGYHDKSGTHAFPELKQLQPMIEYAANQKIPQNNRQRADNRAGTIDQDPEYMAFLEEQTQAIVKPAALEPAADKADKLEIKSTPLIDDLREKKANKAKAASNKNDKKKDDDKKELDAKSSPSRAKGVKSAQATKVEQAAKEAAKALTKQVANKAAAQPQSASTKTASPAKAAAKRQPAASPKQQNATPVQPAAPSDSRGSSSPAPNRLPPGQRPRGNAEGIKKMLQKDLGIGPKPTPGSRPQTPKQNQRANSAAASTVASPTPASPKPTEQGKPPTAPKAQQQQQQAKSAPAPANTAASLSPSSTKAYLKHANPSQGMTEMLILQALSQYGPVNSVTIDPRKGTAIAMFKDQDGLAKALEAKKIPVANGAVEVHAFRDGSTRGGAPTGAPAGPSGRGRGGHRGGRGGVRGGAAAANTSAANVPPANPATPGADAVEPKAAKT